MITLTIDNQRVEVAPGTTVLQAAEKLGIHIPRFCYHKCLSIAGNCRLCLVEIEGTTNPVISCKEPVREGMVVHTTSELARAARADTLEFVLRNHPLDCPVCDQSGECDLQDYFFEHSLRPSRLADPKVNKPKAQRIGPRVILDAERCVECTRCVRFCEEIAGVHEIGLFERGDHSTIGVVEGKELANPYSLMTVDLCPVGALTSIDFRFRKRVWLLTSAPSICLGCATGCNVWMDHEGGVVYRFRPRENMRVNRCLLCDAGRMTRHMLLAENRRVVPEIRRGGERASVDWPEALGFVAGLVRSGQASEIVGVLSAQASVEENEALAALCRGVFKAARLAWSGLDPEPAFADGILRDADRNPNATGVQRIAKDRLHDVKPGAGVVVLDGLGAADLKQVVDAHPAWVVLIAAQGTGEVNWADAILPRPTHAEAGGTYVNSKGIEQRVEPFLKPLAGMKTMMEIAEELAKAIV